MNQRRIVNQFTGRLQRVNVFANGFNNVVKFVDVHSLSGSPDRWQSRRVCKQMEKIDFFATMAVKFREDFHDTSCQGELTEFDGAQ